MKLLCILLLAAGPAFGQSFLPAGRDSLHFRPLLLRPDLRLRPSLPFPPSVPGVFSFGTLSGIPGGRLAWGVRDNRPSWIRSDRQKKGGVETPPAKV